MKTFFPTDVGKNIDPFSRSCANALLTAVKKHGKIKRRYSTAAWAREFTALEKTDGIARSRILATLHFYTANFGKPYIPVALSATGFRKKFLQIEAAARRDIPAGKKIQITDQARAVQRAAGYLQWPGKKETAVELEFIQLSLDRYEKFVMRDLCELYVAELEKAEIEEAQQLAINGTVKSNVWEFYNLVASLYRGMPDPVDYVTEWALRVNRMAHEWDGWHGDLLRAAWRPDSPAFVKRMRQSAAWYGGSPKLWDRVYEKICGADNINSGIGKTKTKGGVT